MSDDRAFQIAENLLAGVRAQAAKRQAQTFQETFERVKPEDRAEVMVGVAHFLCGYIGKMPAHKRAALEMPLIEALGSITMGLEREKTKQRKD